MKEKFKFQMITVFFGLYSTVLHHFTNPVLVPNLPLAAETILNHGNMSGEKFSLGYFNKASDEEICKLDEYIFFSHSIGHYIEMQEDRLSIVTVRLLWM